MFVQVIHGKVSDTEGMHRQLDKWQQELSGGATGWLGSTAGVTADGELVAFVRFDTEEHARQNSDRPEQDSWWSETARLFPDGAKFADTDDVHMEVNGNPDDAKFVQVMEGKSKDTQRLRKMMEDNADVRKRERPDIIGSMDTAFGDGTYAVELFFTSEADAREGERKEPPPEVKAMFDEMDTLAVGPTRFYDLTEPWTYSPAAR